MTVYLKVPSSVILNVIKALEYLLYIQIMPGDTLAEVYLHLSISGSHTECQ